jgi:hypothetical protein
VLGQLKDTAIKTRKTNPDFPNAKAPQHCAAGLLKIKTDATECS